MNVIWQPSTSHSTWNNPNRSDPFFISSAENVGVVPCNVGSGIEETSEGTAVGLIGEPNTSCSRRLKQSDSLSTCPAGGPGGPVQGTMALEPTGPCWIPDPFSWLMLVTCPDKMSAQRNGVICTVRKKCWAQMPLEWQNLQLSWGRKACKINTRLALHQLASPKLKPFPLS